MSRFVGQGRAEVVDPGELISVEQHLQALLDLLPVPDPIELRLSDALGLVLAEPVVSEATLPAFANAAMDGYAVVASDIAGATVESPVSLSITGEVLAGSEDLPEVGHGRAARIMTGAPVPPGADAVVPVETTSGSQSPIGFHRSYPPGANIRGPGEDVMPGQTLVTEGRRLTPADVGLLAAAGATRVTCLPKPRVVVVSSGDELVRAEDEPGPGRVRDANGPMIAAMVRQAGALPYSAGIVPDDRKALMYAFDTNLGHADLFVCSGGASAGTRDLMPDVIGALGEVTTAKVAMKPGMPQIRGLIGRTPVIGLPGNPVSAFVSFEVFVRPVLRRLQGRRDVNRPVVTAVATERMAASGGKRAYLRVRLSREEGRWLASPAGGHGSHMVSSIARADGLAVVPEHVHEVAAGDEVRVHLLVD